MTRKRSAPRLSNAMVDKKLTAQSSPLSGMVSKIGALMTVVTIVKAYESLESYDTTEVTDNPLSATGGEGVHF